MTDTIEISAIEKAVSEALDKTFTDFTGQYLGALTSNLAWSAIAAHETALKAENERLREALVFLKNRSEILSSTPFCYARHVINANICKAALKGGAE